LPFPTYVRFAGAARADAAAEALEVLPHVAQAGQRVLELRHLDLQPRFARARVAGEDGENHLRAVDDLAIEVLLEVPHLRGREVVVAGHRVGRGLRDEALQLLELALGQERGRRRPAALLHEFAHDARARRVDEARQLVHRGAHLGGAAAAGETDQDRALGALGFAWVVDGRASWRGVEKLPCRKASDRPEA